MRSRTPACSVWSSSHQASSSLVRSTPTGRELAAHEEQLLAGMRPHVRVERAQVRELLPAVARHLRQQRALAVHDLVVRERQDEVLVPRVDERRTSARGGGSGGGSGRAGSSSSVSCIQPMFHLKPKPSPPRYVGRDTPGHAVDSSAAVMTPGSRAYTSSFSSFRNATASRSSRPPNCVRDPLAGLARVVEVEHRRDGVDAQPVGVVLAQPEERVREQEVAHLGAPEVEDERAPVGMRAAPRVRVLVERGAVECASAHSSRGKCAGTQSSSTPMPVRVQWSTK